MEKPRHTIGKPDPRIKGPPLPLCRHCRVESRFRIPLIIVESTLLRIVEMADHIPPVWGQGFALIYNLFNQVIADVVSADMHTAEPHSLH